MPQSTQQPNLQLFLDRLTSRSALSATERQAILDLPVRVEQVQPNRDFVSLGDRVDHACLIVAGLVGRFDQNSGGERQITALNIAGDMPDLASVVQPTATSALQALSTATVLKVPHAALRNIGAAHPAIAEAFWRDCMVDAMILAQWVVNVGRRDAKTRIAHVLCEMAWRTLPAPRSGNIVYNLQMTQNHLADATGLTPVHVNRSLKALTSDGLTFRDRIVRIEDWDRFAEVADFDPGYLQTNFRPDQWMRLAS
jgi:CRP-like cAMP-binding protein